jgi:hypothetical protein
MISAPCFIDVGVRRSTSHSSRMALFDSAAVVAHGHTVYSIPISSRPPAIGGLDDADHDDGHAH